MRKKSKSAVMASYHINSALEADRNENVRQHIKFLKELLVESRQVKSLFEEAKVEVGDEQLIKVTLDAINIFRCCWTREEKVQRILDLSKIACFKEPEM